MRKVVLLSCTKEKLNYKSKVEDLYSPSPRFNDFLKLAKNMNADKILVISAKHHVLELDDEIEPYDANLEDFLNVDKKKWGLEIIKQLKEKNCDLDNDQFFLILDANYRKFIEPYLKHHIS